METRNPQYNAAGTIDLEINHPEFGWIPFTATPDDVEEHGRQIFAEALAGNFGPIAPYVAPVVPEPTLEQRIAEYEKELDKHLDGVAKSYRFADRKTLALRAGYPGPYHDLGLAYATWMDTCNAQAYAQLQRVLNGEEQIPTVEQFLSTLPTFTYP